MLLINVEFSPFESKLKISAILAAVQGSLLAQLGAKKAAPLPALWNGMLRCSSCMTSEDYLRSIASF